VDDISAPHNVAILGAMFGVPEQEFIRRRHWLDDFFKREVPEPGQESSSQVVVLLTEGSLEGIRTCLGARRRVR
jgi:cytochrome P450